VSRLQFNAREVAVAATLLCLLVKAEKAGCSRWPVLEECEKVGGHVAQVVQVVADRRWLERGETDCSLVMELINSTSSLLPVSDRLVSGLQHLISIIDEPSMGTLLSSVIQFTIIQLNNLRLSIAKVTKLYGPAINDMTISVAHGLIQSTRSILEECRHTPLSLCFSPPLSPLPTNSVAVAAQHLNSLLLPLTYTARPCEVTSHRGREIGQSLQQLKQACYSLACQSEVAEKQVSILEALLAVLETGQEVLIAAKSMMESPDCFQGLRTEHRESQTETSEEVF
jgi:hypothetical protein